MSRKMILMKLTLKIINYKITSNMLGFIQNRLVKNLLIKTSVQFLH